LDFRLDTKFDIIYSSGVLHYIAPEHREEIMDNYKKNTAMGGIHALNAFVSKPFIGNAPENETAYPWKSGELFLHYADWLIRSCNEIVFDCDSSGIPHKHCMDIIMAERK